MPPVPQPASSTGPVLCERTGHVSSWLCDKRYAGRDTTTCGPRPRACARIRPVPRRVRPRECLLPVLLMISSSCLANRRDQAPTVPPSIERLLLLPLIALPILWLAGYFFPPINHDVAAILDVSARWVNGERLYVEVIDENLPLTFVVHAPARADLQDPAGRPLVLVHRLGGGRHLRLVLGLPATGEAGAVGRPCAHRGAAAAGPAVPVHRAAQRAFRPARAHRVRGLGALHDRLDGRAPRASCWAAARRSPSAWLPAWRWR